MSVVNLPQDGPIFIPGENPGDPGTLILGEIWGQYTI